MIRRDPHRQTPAGTHALDIEPIAPAPGSSQLGLRPDWHATKRDALARRLLSKLDHDPDRLAASVANFAEAGQADAVALHPRHAPEPDQLDALFDAIRWGGCAVLLAHKPRLLDAWKQQLLQAEGFLVTDNPRRLEPPRPWRRATHGLLVRKNRLDQPHRRSARFSYDLTLEPAAQAPHGWAVVKRVPSVEITAQKLLANQPNAQPEEARNYARKLIQKVFPVLLTREAAFLKLNTQHLPPTLARRTPQLLWMKRDDHGYAREIGMTWLRMGGHPRPAIRFAAELAEVLCALHEHARVMHLDLRLDNVVATPAGAGIVDFGSAVRFGENVHDAPLLGKIFESMLGASQIGSDLRRLRKRKHLTSPVFDPCFPGIHPAIDLFSLALQMPEPHKNPDLRGLVQHQPKSLGAQRLAQLRREVLQPNDPSRPAFHDVADLAHALHTAAEDLTDAPRGSGFHHGSGLQRIP
ncbi:MAG: hypothetical protein AAGA57_06650 [Planctomycetota bacterium]